MELEKARVDFVNLQKRLCAYNHATSLIYYDGATSAPPDTVANRNHSIQILNEEVLRLTTADETIELLNFLDERREYLTVKEQRALDFMLKEYKMKQLIPPDEFVKQEILLNEARDAWHRAQEEDDFEILRPYLEKVFDTARTIAGYCAPEMDPYEYYLNYYEEGMDVKTCDELFGAIRENITPLLRKIMEKPQVDDSCIKGDFSKEDQESLAIYVMELVGLNMNRVGLATSEHPFAMYLGSHYDQRITTKYLRKDFTDSLYTVLHEAGQVLYDMGQADNLAYTVIDGAMSMGMIESQACFYENIIGRSRHFIQYIYPELAELFPDPVEKYTAEDIYRAVNKVDPGLIRIGADELTLSLHVMIRYELEKAIMDKKLEVKDLPEAWAAKYKEYLGVDVPNHTKGVLQDIHWAFGAIGYFPSYIVGSAFAAQIMEKMDEDIELNDCIDEANYKLINLWNKEHIWKHGGLYPTKTIMERFVGQQFSSDAYIRYLTEKYSDIYGL